MPAGHWNGVRAAVLDMDGTLVDSCYDWPDIRRRLRLFGPSLIDEINALPSPAREERWRALEAIEAEGVERARLMPGTVELIDTFHGAGIATALVTNNSAANTRALLERFGLHFEVVVTRDSGLWKPSPAPLLEAIRRLGVEPSEVVVVGDSPQDVMAARAAGCARVCILHRGDEGHGREADCAFADIAGFIRYLEGVL